MKKLNEFHLVITTCSTLQQAERISKLLIENKLAACVNIIQNIQSIYEWKGQIQQDSEMLLGQ